MPFPLAHPAAVLPLRRYCPRFLSFPALVIGSVAPDLGYGFGNLHVEDFSHTLLGTFGFSLPVGLLILWLLYLLRSRVVTGLPERFRRVFMPLCQRPPGSLAVMAFSLLVGSWTHLLWDSFTHKQGWFVQRLPILQVPVAFIAGHNVRVFHLLWYGCSFAGVACLCVVFENWMQAAEGAAGSTAGKVKVQNAVVAGFLTLVLGAVHHLNHHGLGSYLVAFLSLLLVVGVVLRIGNTGADGRSRRS
jgi:hypothetical protein